MKRSIPIPLVTIGLGLTQGCQTDLIDPNDPNDPSDRDVDPLVGDWTAIRVADEDYPSHDEQSYGGYYGSYSHTVDKSAELSVYEDLSGYFDTFIHTTSSYGGQSMEYDNSFSMTLNVPSVEGSKYSMVLRTDGQVSKLDCVLDEDNLTCTDHFEKAWDFERQ